MSRYKVVSPWDGVDKAGSFYLQTADIVDTKTGVRYAEGAYRVVDARHDMKPAKTGRGGTVPFLGESAWSDGERLMRDLAFAEKRAEW